MAPTRTSLEMTATVPPPAPAVTASSVPSFPMVDPGGLNSCVHRSKSDSMACSFFQTPLRSLVVGRSLRRSRSRKPWWLVVAVSVPSIVPSRWSLAAFVVVVVVVVLRLSLLSRCQPLSVVRPLCFRRSCSIGLEPARLDGLEPRWLIGLEPEWLTVTFRCRH